MQALYVSMDEYLQGLFVLANDPAPEVRKLVHNFSSSSCIMPFSLSKFSFVSPYVDAYMGRFPAFHVFHIVIHLYSSSFLFLNPENEKLTLQVGKGGRLMETFFLYI